MFDRFIAEISTGFINLTLEEIDNEIINALKKIGVMLGIDYICLFTFSEDYSKAYCSYQWQNKVDEHQADHSEFQLDISVRLDKELMNYYSKDVRNPFVISKKTLFPDQNLQISNNLALIPMVLGNRPYGFLGFDYDKSNIKTHEDIIPILKTACGIFVNVLERKRFEEIMYKTQDQLDNFFNVSLDMHCIAGFDGYFKRLNPTWTRILGCSYDELYAVPFLDFIHPDDLAETNKAVENIIDGTGLKNFENRFRCKDGKYKWFLWSGSAIADQELIYAAARDITEMKETLLRLERDDEFIKSLVNTVIDGIITISDHGKILSFNPAAETIFGYTANEILGKNVKLLMPEPHHGNHDNYLARYLDTGNARIIGHGRELQGLRKDKTLFDIDLSVSEMTVGNKKMFTGIIRDITEKRRTEKALEEAKIQAETANKTKSEFLAKMSHELRTPLNSIIGFANVMLKNKSDNLTEKDMTFLSRMQSNGIHLLELINDILDLSKIEAGKTELEIMVVDLKLLVRTTLQQLDIQAGDKGIELIAEIPPLVTQLETDEAKLKQVLINLIGNAIKFTEKGKITVKIVTEPDTNAPVYIEVIDEGIGIPEDKLGLIFDAFNQADGSISRKYKGTGLGLSISKSLCSLLGYDLTVSSKLGSGSKFTIVFRRENT